ncbi:lysozyme [Kaistia adipata]|uniref:lysozyme n=1 Tax=Kaistia adipata TaxID=166954 RepID=UPI00048CAECD|nr:lysozyme [Kaistia adipata]
MPKLAPSKRGKAAIAAVLAVAVGGLVTMSGERVPDDVALAAQFLVKPWEGRELRAYPDPATGGAPWTICDGDTKGVKPGMQETPAGCDRRLVRRMGEFRGQLVACVPGFAGKPLSWRAMMNSLAYNIGTGAACRSTAARLGAAGRFVDSCNAATAFNKASGRVFIGLVNRREMGDARRIGEGELCVSGLK